MLCVQCHAIANQRQGYPFARMKRASAISLKLPRRRSVLQRLPPFGRHSRTHALEHIPVTDLHGLRRTNGRSERYCGRSRMTGAPQRKGITPSEYRCSGRRNRAIAPFRSVAVGGLSPRERRYWRRRSLLSSSVQQDMPLHWRSIDDSRRCARCRTR